MSPWAGPHLWGLNQTLSSAYQLRVPRALARQAVVMMRPRLPWSGSQTEAAKLQARRRRKPNGGSLTLEDVDASWRESSSSAAASRTYNPVGGNVGEYLVDQNSTNPEYLAKVWPTVFIIGAPKAGTTSIASLLFKHSGFCRPLGVMKKETHFFSSTRTYAHGRDGYLKHFGHDSKCAQPVSPARADRANFTHQPILAGKVHWGSKRHVDATPNYMRVVEAPGRIAATLPRALLPHLKFIVALREPVSRDLSWFNHQKATKHFYCDEYRGKQAMRNYNVNANITLACLAPGR